MALFMSIDEPPLAGTMVEDAEAEGEALPADVAGTEPEASAVDSAGAVVDAPGSVVAAPVTGVGSEAPEEAISVVAPEVMGVLGKPGVTEALVTATVVVDEAGTVVGADELLERTQSLAVTVTVSVTAWRANRLKASVPVMATTATRATMDLENMLAVTMCNVQLCSGLDVGVEDWVV